MFGAALCLTCGERATFGPCYPATRVRQPFIWSKAFTRLRRASHFQNSAFTHLRRASHFLLGGQEKVTKEKATQVVRSPGILPCESARLLRGSLSAHPCTRSELARIVRASLRPFLRSLAAPHGTHWAASCRRSDKPEAKSLPVPNSQSRDGRISTQAGAVAVQSIAGGAGKCP